MAAVCHGRTAAPQAGRGLGPRPLEVHVDDPPAGEAHRDAAVEIRPVGGHTRRGELLENLGSGMPVGVVRPDADERHLRTRCREDAGRVRVGPVVGHLQDLGPQGLPVTEHERLGEQLRVTGEQDPAVWMVEAEHERDLVQVRADRSVRRR